MRRKASQRTDGEPEVHAVAKVLYGRRDRATNGYRREKA
jgi:hypothetical protein